MQINKNRKGLALGVALSLLASVFVGAAPASATTPVDGDKIAITPAAGPVTNFNGLLQEDFPIEAYLLPGVSNNQFASNKVIMEVTKVSGAMEVLVNTASAIADDSDPTSSSPDVNGYIQASSSAAATFLGTVASSKAIFNVRAYTASGVVSSSPSVTLNVKIWVENVQTENGVWDALEWYTTKTITLHSLNNVTATTTVAALDAGDTVITASGTVSALNFQNIGGVFFLQVESTNDHLLGGDPAKTVSAAVSGETLADRAGVVSQSFVVSGSSGVTAATSVSAHLRYHSSAAADGGERVGAIATAVVTGTKTDDLLVDVVAGNHATQSGGTAVVRANQTYTFTVGAESTSDNVSVSGAVVSVALSGGPTLGVNVKEISVNGAASTTSYPTALSLTTNASGVATFTVTTIGFVDGDDFTITATEGNISQALAVQVEATNPVLTADYSLLSTGVGTSVPVTYSVKDQWGVSSAATDLRVKITKGGSGFAYTDTVSYVAVSGGKATFNFTPAPATKTGSATVTALLQQMQSSTGVYLTETGSTDLSVTVNVAATSNAFGTGLAASYAASVSYFPSTLAAAVAMGGKVVNTGSAVVVSGAGLVFGDASGATASDTITVRANGSLNYSVDVWSTKTGTFTVTFTNGTATTTSLLVVSEAGSDMGASIVWDTTTIGAGKTRIVTGTLLDVNGNPVNTAGPGRTAGDSGTASILVSYAGSAGIAVGVMPTETDADGKFRISVLTAAADRGTFTVTAAYYPQGASTAVRNVVSSVNAITVGEATATPASDQKLTVGSFKGFVAIYALNYTGQKLSAKVAGKWLVVNELSKFQRVVRNTGAGFTIKVDLYIDGAFVRSETVVTK